MPVSVATPDKAESSKGDSLKTMEHKTLNRLDELIVNQATYIHTTLV